MIRRFVSVAVNTFILHRNPVKYLRGQGVNIGEGVEIRKHLRVDTGSLTPNAKRALPIRCLPCEA
jgi:hypothetical protein